MLDAGIQELARLTARAVAREMIENRPPPIRWLRPADAAVYLGLSKDTLERYRRLGAGPRFTRVSSKCIRYDVRALDEWMTGGAEA